MISMAEKDVCPRCHGKGVLETCAHVRNGICFRCWGTGYDLVAERKQLIETLTGLRNQYRRVSAKLKAAESVELRNSLDVIVARGLAARNMLTQLEIEVRTRSGNL